MRNTATVEQYKAVHKRKVKKKKTLSFSLVTEIIQHFFTFLQAQALWKVKLSLVKKHKVSHSEDYYHILVNHRVLNLPKGKANLINMASHANSQ